MVDSLHLLPGFRFHPTDEEIITYYLLQKVIDQSFESIAIGEGSFNECEPWELPGKANIGEKEWYFFCKRDRKYPTGMRTNRATSSGYWKATGKDKEIFKGKGVLVGMKKTLVFYSGRAPRGMKTKWVMHEYRLEGKYQYNIFSTSQQDEWVVCKVYNKKDPKSSTTQQEVAETMNNSFVDDLLVDTPDHLPPLTDSQFFYNSRNQRIDEANAQENDFIQSFFLEKISNSNSIFSASMDTGLSSERNMEENGCFESYDKKLSTDLEQVNFDGVWNNGLI